MTESNSMQDWPKRNYQFTLPLRYHLSAPSGPGLVICLHGFQDHALSLIRRIGWWQSKLPFQILAINGPFPVPQWTVDGFREAYSWYFRDTAAKIMLVDPVTTAQTLRQFITELDFENTPKVIFGFSQGGYMAPYLASQLKEVRGIVGLGCGYNIEAYAQCAPLMVHAIHGDVDERVPIAQSRAAFAKLDDQGHRGSFHEIPNLTHRVEYSIEPLVRQVILQSFRTPLNGGTAEPQP